MKELGNYLQKLLGKMTPIQSRNRIILKEKQRKIYPSKFKKELKKKKGIHKTSKIKPTQNSITKNKNLKKK